jgi:hypothetical protein
MFVRILFKAKMSRERSWTTILARAEVAFVTDTRLSTSLVTRET